MVRAGVFSRALVQVLHVMEAFRAKRMFRPNFTMFALAYIMQKMRAGEHTRVDVAHTAHIIGEWRAGFRRQDSDMLHPVLQELVAVIEMRSAEYLKVGQFSARQIATVMWMFGRLTAPPESMELRNLLSSYICNQVCVPPGRATVQYLLLAVCMLILCLTGCVHTVSGSGPLELTGANSVRSNSACSSHTACCCSTINATRWTWPTLRTPLLRWSTIRAS